VQGFAGRTFQTKNRNAVRPVESDSEVKSSKLIAPSGGVGERHRAERPRSKSAAGFKQFNDPVTARRAPLNSLQTFTE